LFSAAAPAWFQPALAAALAAALAPLRNTVGQIQNTVGQVQNSITQLQTAVDELKVFSNVVRPFFVFPPSFIGSNQDNRCTIVSVKTAVPLHTKSSYSKTAMTQQM
jgi:hypothetical protein